MVRPARWLRSRDGDPRLGVGVDGRRRLDQHQDLGVAGQRPDQHQPLPLAAREACGRARPRRSPVPRAAGRGCRPADAVSIARSRASLSCRPVTSRLSSRRPEKSEAPVSETTIRRRTSSRVRAVSGTPPRVTSSSGSGAHMPSRSASAADSSGCSLTMAVIVPGRIRSPVRAVRQLRHRRRRRGRLLGVGPVGVERQHPADALGGDPSADQLVGVLGGRAQRDHQERRVAVEGHQLTGRDLARDRRAGAQPDDHDHEDPGQEDLERVEHRLQLGDLYPGPASRLRLATVALVEDVLTADAAQHP